ncbi:NFACT family protein [Candidatus Woesearchaeota archaeon]|nr:NFACT family protein [Candidatus Woesearchaeota archaeon]HIH37594.1 hypothetical protein [Candidatus Woesearchaeota archaeon]HIH48714.1 hypothetical protein [Candidatus Woesearchaeota archaeon]
MKKHLTGVELHFVIEEISCLIGAKVAAVFQPYQDDFLLQLFKGEKYLLRIKLPGYLYLTEFKQQNPSKPFAFCMALRKYLESTILEEIKQQGVERTVTFRFRGKEGMIFLIVELFSKGNLILCREDMSIIRLWTQLSVSSRELRAGQLYAYPEQRTSPFGISKEDFMDKVKGSSKDTAVTMLAIDFGLGGVYAEEVCSRSGIEKNHAPRMIDDEQLQGLFVSLEQVLSQKSLGILVKEEGGKIIDIVPFDLKTYAEQELQLYSTYNEALDAGVSELLLADAEEKSHSGYDTKVARLTRIIAEQEEHIKELEEKATEDQRKGELIYEHYEELNKLLADIQKIEKDHSWQEIKKKVEGHKNIKAVDPKMKVFVLEL